MVAAREVARDLAATDGGRDAVVVVLLPDSGRNYLSKLYNDEWMRANGLLATTGRGRPGRRPARATATTPAELPDRRPRPDDRARRRRHRAPSRSTGSARCRSRSDADGDDARGHRRLDQREGPARPGLPRPVDRRADRRRGDGPAAAARRRRGDPRRGVRAAVAAARRRVVAIRGDRPVGIVTKLDLLEYLAHRPSGLSDATAMSRGRPPIARRRRGWRSTRCAVHAGAEPDELTGAVSPPIYQTSTYAQDGVGRPRGGYEYARIAEPDPRAPRAGGRRRSRAARHGIAFASGSAATAAIAELAAPGDEIVVGDDVYGGTYRYLERVRRGRRGRRPLRRPGGGPGRALGGADRADAARLVRDADRTRCSRSSTSPASARRVARARGAEGGRRPLVVVDNTFASPALQRPLDARRGHRLPLGDEVPRRPLGHDPRASRSRRTTRSPSGCASSRTRWAPCPGPFDCFLVLRGLRTLAPADGAPRRERAAVASSWPRADVARSAIRACDRRHAHPQAALAARQMRGGRRDGLVRARPPAGAHGRTRGRARRSRSARRPGCSRWPSRSAASSR